MSKKPCPFCGKSPIRRKDWQLTCGEKGCPGSMVLVSETKWNQRTSDPEIVQRIKDAMLLFDTMGIDYYYSHNHAMIKNLEQSLGRAYCILKETLKEYQNDT